jgi:hypothetical protein
MDEHALWDKARTVADLGELTARWLEGSISWNPTYTNGDTYAAEVGTFNRPPEDETKPYVHLLAAVNRAGFVTNFSQPGEVACREPSFVSFLPQFGDKEPTVITWPHDERDRWQRASVFGFMDPTDGDKLRLLRSHCEDAGLTVFSWNGASRCPNGGAITDIIFVGATTPTPTSETDFKHAAGGYTSRPSVREIRSYSRYPKSTHAALESTLYVIVTDSEIGRNDRLWPALTSWLSKVNRRIADAA